MTTTVLAEQSPSPLAGEGGRRPDEGAPRLANRRPSGTDPSPPTPLPQGERGETRGAARFLPDGRLHLHDGPIDLIIEAFGAPAEIQTAYAAAARRFTTVLNELCAELPLLRAPAPCAVRPKGRVARRMAEAVAPFAATRFLTPMAAVAGAVAEEILGVMIEAADLAKIYVNNGGDVALHLAPGESFRIGLVPNPERLALDGAATIRANDPVRGIATSGWRGRSFSLGIADAVTVLARSAALADAAATLIANAVDLPGHPAILRAPARSRDPQSDLGGRLVTIGVGRLCRNEADYALRAGVCEAEMWRGAGLIEAAALRCQGETRLVGPQALV